MVYECETLKLCHNLTEKGEFEYHKLLDYYADQILFENKYPLFSKIMKIMNFFKIKIRIIEKIYDKMIEEIKNGKI